MFSVTVAKIYMSLDQFQSTGNGQIGYCVKVDGRLTRTEKFWILQHRFLLHTPFLPIRSCLRSRLAVNTFLSDKKSEFSFSEHLIIKFVKKSCKVANFFRKCQKSEHQFIFKKACTILFMSIPSILFRDTDMPLLFILCLDVHFIGRCAVFLYTIGTMAAKLCIHASRAKLCRNVRYCFRR